MADAQDGGTISELLNTEELREEGGRTGHGAVVEKEERGTERKPVKLNRAGS